MAAQLVSRTSPPPQISTEPEDVAQLRAQLTSLQMALESREKEIDDLRDKTESILWKVGSEVSLFPQNLPCITFLKDPSGRYIFANRLWERVHRKSQEGWLKKTDSELFTPEVAASFRKSDRQVIESGLAVQTIDSFDLEGHISHWLVTKFPVATVSGDIGLVGGVAVDITETRAAEQLLRGTEGLYRELVDGVVAGVYRATPEGKVLLANPALVRMLGYGSYDDLAASNLNDAYNGSHSGSGFAEAMDHDGQILGFESVWRRNDGQELPVRETAKTVRGSNGAILYYDGVVEDRTETHRAQMLERDRNRLLELIARNENLSEIFNELCLMVERQFPGRRCGAMRLREGVLDLVGGPNLPAPLVEALRHGLLVDPDVGACGRAAYLGETVVVTDTTIDPLWGDLRELAKRSGVKSCWSTPILSGDRRVLGTLGVYHPESLQPLESELDLLRTASRLAAIAIEHRNLLSDLEKQAKYDPLSTLPNRFLFEDRLESALESARAESKEFCVLWVGLDRFQKVNDTLGHRIGDALLRQVTQRLAGCCSDSETLARMGGDEFALLLPDISTREEAEKRAEAILAMLRIPLQIEGFELFVTASIGISFYPNDGSDSTALQCNANRAMYCAKSRGRDASHCYESGIGEGALERLKLENDLRHAVGRNELELFYQPQLDLDGTLRGFEALIRWNHPKQGLLMPGQFIAIAEDSGMIVPIGAWVVRQACHQLAIWRSFYPEIKIAVNVSAMQFYYGDFVETVREALLVAGIEPGCLEIELTESLVMKNYEESARQLEKLRDIGVSIAIDDFGTGHSSLSNLLRLPANTLKIDRSFLADVERSRNRAVVKAIATLSRNLGLSVVAEGIERPEQLEIVKEIGVDLVQGYLLGRPIPAGATEERFFPSLRSNSQFVST